MSVTGWQPFGGAASPSASWEIHGRRLHCWRPALRHQVRPTACAVLRLLPCCESAASRASRRPGGSSGRFW